MKRNLLIMLLAVALVTVLGTINAVEEQYAKATLLKIGDKVPDFTLTDLGGKKMTQADLKGNVTYFNLFTTWCGSCNQKWPALEKDIWQSFKDDANFKMVSVGREHSKAELVAFKKAKNLNSPLAADPKRDVYKLFAEKWIPRAVIVGPDGTLLYQSVGYDDVKIKAEKQLVRDQLAKLAAP